MTDFFFHLGMHKTATTWFQNQFFPNLEGVKVVHTQHIANVPKPRPNAPTLIVSHAGLSANLSIKKTPGSNTEWLAKNLSTIKECAPESAIIIGFREHKSWLDAAYCNKAKKTWGMTRPDYLATFSPRDLSWCQTLQAIDSLFENVFPFLYEELVRAPQVLVEDLCKFINKAPPANLNELLIIRRNPSPRSDAGQFVSRLLYALAATSRSQFFKQNCGPLGARLDRYFHIPKFTLESQLSQHLSQDWNKLINVIGKRRRRDLSYLGPHG